MSLLIPDLDPSTRLDAIDAAISTRDGKLRAGLEKLGLVTVSDLLGHFPRRHEDRTRFDRFPDQPAEEPVCARGVVVDAKTRFVRGRGKGYFEATVEPPEGGALGQRLVCRWFHMPWLKNAIFAGHEMVLYGRPKMSGKRLVMDHPEYEIVNGSGADGSDGGDDGSDPELLAAHMGRIVPVYPLVKGLPQKALRELVYRVLESLTDDQIEDRIAACLPPGHEGPSRASALRAAHFPPSLEALGLARRRLALEEFALLQRELLLRKRNRQDRGGADHCGPGELLEKFLAALPFAPTGAQERTIAEVRADLASDSPMARLLQGDVGSGKTLVAAAAVLLVVEAGFDAALMAPTQILAEQHFRTFSEWFEPLGVTVVLRTGSREAGGEMPLFDAAASASSGGSGTSGPSAPRGRLVVGTHALIHGAGEEWFPRGLGLAVIDEQHKFGVAQRENLVARGVADNGENGAGPDPGPGAPDVLALTATPIPRTLTLSFYGDLDLSVLDEKPPGRGKVITGIRLVSQSEEAAVFLRDQIAAGRQAYIVYPLIEESDKVEAGAATAEFGKWRERLPDARLVLLHGRMSPEEKDGVMERFRRGEADVLVSTTVIEVGVDVPNASVMLIYHAERFGLAQIHQLRGRIGRGEHKSYCVLMCSPDQPEALERLRVLEETSDGFRIAEEDLRQRGPGEVLGTQQSGLPDLAFADLLGDSTLVREAREVAERMLDR